MHCLVSMLVRYCERRTRKIQRAATAGLQVRTSIVEQSAMETNRSAASQSYACGVEVLAVC
jgi:hypothetical protein